MDGKFLRLQIDLLLAFFGRRKVLEAVAESIDDDLSPADIQARLRVLQQKRRQRTKDKTDGSGADALEVLSNAILNRTHRN